jgi:hypothetical protein
MVQGRRCLENQPQPEDSHYRAIDDISQQTPGQRPLNISKRLSREHA